MRRILAKIIEADSQIHLIALQTAVYGIILAGCYLWSHHNNNFMAAMIGLLTNSLMLTQNYHGNNSYQRLSFSFIFSIVCSFLFGLATFISGSAVYSSLLILCLIPLLTILNDHQLLRSFAFYLAYAFILGLGFSANSQSAAIMLAAFFALGCFMLVAGGFIRLWIRDKLLNIPEVHAVAKYSLVSHPEPRDISFVIVLTIAVTGSNIFAYALNLSHGYWLPLTTLLVFRDEHYITIRRVYQRIAGTIIGITLAYVFLFNLGTFGLSIGLMILFYLCIITINRYYLVFCIVITLLVMDMLFLSDSNKDILHIRLLATVISVVLVVFASMVVKIWAEKRNYL